MTLRDVVYVDVVVTKPQRERKKRLDEVVAWKSPGLQAISLPSLPKGSSVAAFTFSIHEGMRWRVSPMRSVTYSSVKYNVIPMFEHTGCSLMLFTVLIVVLHVVKCLLG